jgi:hypothetical protein
LQSLHGTINDVHLGNALAAVSVFFPVMFFMAFVTD